MNVIGPNIRIIRERKKLTQEQLSAKCNLLEWDISRSTLAKIESKSRRVIDLEVIILAKALNVSISEIFEPGM